MHKISVYQQKMKYSCIIFLVWILPCLAVRGKVKHFMYQLIFYQFICNVSTVNYLTKCKILQMFMKQMCISYLCYCYRNPSIYYYLFSRKETY
jgi:hypothetical protein